MGCVTVPHSHCQLPRHRDGSQEVFSRPPAHSFRSDIERQGHGELLPQECVPWGLTLDTHRMHVEEKQGLKCIESEVQGNTFKLSVVNQPCLEEDWSCFCSSPQKILQDCWCGRRRQEHGVENVERGTTIRKPMNKNKRLIFLSILWGLTFDRCLKFGIYCGFSFQMNMTNFVPSFMLTFLYSLFKGDPPNWLSFRPHKARPALVLGGKRRRHSRKM